MKCLVTKCEVLQHTSQQEPSVTYIHKPARTVSVTYIHKPARTVSVTYIHKAGTISGGDRMTVVRPCDALWLAVTASWGRERRQCLSSLHCGRS